jgi:hypothetical protein
MKSLPLALRFLSVHELYRLTTPQFDTKTEALSSRWLVEPPWFVYHALIHVVGTYCYETEVMKRKKQTNKQTPWPLVRKRSITTERPTLVDEI